MTEGGYFPSNDEYLDCGLRRNDEGRYFQSNDERLGAMNRAPTQKTYSYER